MTTIIPVCPDCGSKFIDIYSVTPEPRTAYAHCNQCGFTARVPEHLLEWDGNGALAHVCIPITVDWGGF